tara:strand:- start:528 stop:893 length:366 start_codon:yes stop_codon:yes gene_type:complete
MDPVALAAELTGGHPDTGAYDADASVAAGQLNAVNRTLPKATMTASEVFNAIDKTEFNALVAADQQLVWDILHLGELNPYGLEATLFTDTFGAGTDTIIALNAARTTAVSRAVEIGLGTVG